MVHPRNSEEFDVAGVEWSGERSGEKQKMRIVILEGAIVSDFVGSSEDFALSQVSWEHWVVLSREVT